MYWHDRSRRRAVVPRRHAGESKGSAPRGAVDALWGGRRANLMDNRASNRETHDGRIRYELVERIRQEIAAGTYETPEKLDRALECLLERLEEE